MIKIEAIIRPGVLEKVARALDEAGITGFHTVDIQGHGRQRGQTEIFRGQEYDLRFRSKVRLVIITTEEMQDHVENIILQNAGTGEVGDGKIFTSPISDVIRIRTGEHGIGAL